MGSMLMQALKTSWTWLKELGGVLMPCRFSIIMLGLVQLFLLGLPPGQDLLRSLAELQGNALHVFGNRLLFFSALTLWAVNGWYWARVMLRFSFDDPAKESVLQSPRQESMRKHVPRLIGFLAFVVVGVAFYGASLAYTEDADRHIRLTLHIMTATCAAMGTVFYTFTAVRRRVITSLARKRDQAREAPASHFRASLYSYRSLDKSSKLAVLLSFLLSAVLFVMFLVAPGSASTFGTATIVLLAASSWIPAGSVLVYAGSFYRLPVISLVVAIVLFFSLFNDNHDIRTLKGSSAPVAGRTIEEDFPRWLEDGMKRWPRALRQPVFVVATEGGGIRAAYWTGIVLSALQDRNPAFVDHLYAISGVSGGSLGASVFTALVRQQLAGGSNGLPIRTRQRIGPMQRSAQAILSSDFLAPVSAYLLYPDLVQRFLPCKISRFDRSRAMEKAWEKSWRAETGNGRFSDGFHALWANGGERMPALFLNSTWVEQGKRIITSNLAVTAAEFSDAIDFFRVFNAEPPLSAAVHNSARFTYVSPAGKIERHPGGEEWGHLVDGGYFDNSGASTALEVLSAMKEGVEEQQWKTFVPIVIMITNDPTLNNDAVAKPTRFMNELLSPVRTLFNTRPARAGYSRCALQAWVEQEGGAFVTAGLDDSHGPLPLSWVLSDLARDTMQKQLDEFLTKLSDPMNMDSLRAMANE